MIKNIIFDWSGTLSDDFRCVYDAVMKVFAELDVKQITFEEFKKEFRLPYMDFYKRYTDTPQEKLIELYNKAINTVDDPQVFPGVKETLAQLKDRGIKMAVLSSHPHDNVMKEMERYGLADMFAEVVGSVHDKREVIQKIMDNNKFTAEDTAYVGDMIHDIETGKMVGVLTIGMTWGYDEEWMIMEAMPDIIIEDITALLEVLI